MLSSLFHERLELKLDHLFYTYNSVGSKLRFFQGAQTEIESPFQCLRSFPPCQPMGGSEGLGTKIFFKEPDCIFKSYLNVL